MMNATNRRHVPRCISVILVLSTVACGGDEATPDRVSIDLRSVPFPCQAEGYPCTWNDVPEAVVERTKHLGQIASLMTLTTPSLDSVAAFLEGREGVAEVEIEGTGVRYRLEGGRPAWVFLPDELDHHRAKPLTTVSRSDVRRRVRSRLGATLDAAGEWLVPHPLHAAIAQDQEKQEVAGTPGEGKRALLISPYEYEFPGVGARFTRRARLIRDYDRRKAEHADVVFHADLDAYSDNPADPGSEYRTVSGETVLSGEVVFEDFLEWDRYNLIVLATHGGAALCDRRIAVGGRVPGRVRPGPDVRQSDPAAVPECPLIYAGRAKQESYGTRFGVEIYFMTGSLAQSDRPSDSQTRFDTPGRREWHDAGRLPDPGLTPAQARACEQRVLAGESDPATEHGEPCLHQRWEHDNPTLVLWWPFFMNAYPEGLNNAIVFLAACHSSKGNILLDALASDGDEAITVFGFSTTTYAPRAWALIDRMLELIDDGYHSQELVDRLKKYDKEIGRQEAYRMQPTCDDLGCTTPENPDQVVRGRTLDPWDDELPDVPAELENEVTVRTHGRDVVLLVDPATGEELRDGGSVRVLGTPGDGRPGRLEVYPQILGIADEADLRGVHLEVRVVDEAIPDETYIPERQVDEGAYRHDRDIALGRDHVEGEVVDLEVRVELPGGTYSRWVYENIRLIGRCYWTASIRGDIERDLGGEAVSIGHLDGGSLGVFGGVTLSQAPGHDGEQDGIWFQLVGVPAQGDYIMDPRRGEAGAMLLTREAPWGTVRRGQLRLAMVTDTMAVGGFAIEYDGLTLPELDANRFTITGEFVWTPSCPTWIDHMMDLGERTRDFVQSRMR